jgi:hypothetical protein
MSRVHAVFLSLFAAAALAAGTAALAHTLHLGAASNKTSNLLLLKRSRQLVRFEASLRVALHRKPPPLPRVPRVKAPVVKPPPPVALPAPAPAAAPIAVAPAASPPPPVSAAAPTPALAAAKTPRVIYRRPPPIVIHVHRHGGDAQDSQQPGGDGGNGTGD